jgi:uncharacterized membrane protein YbaN (DUF454 family)
VLRIGYVLLGFLSMGLGAIGAFVPLLPTVPFMLLAAFFFARSSPKMERRLLEHPTVGPHIAAWRSRGAISRNGKRAALIAFTISATVGLVALPFPWSVVPLIAALIGGSWIWTRPE